MRSEDIENILMNVEVDPVVLAKASDLWAAAELAACSYTQDRVKVIIEHHAAVKQVIETAQAARQRPAPPPEGSLNKEMEVRLLRTLLIEFDSLVEKRLLLSDSYMLLSIETDIKPGIIRDWDDMYDYVPSKNATMNEERKSRALLRYNQLAIWEPL